MGRQKMKCTKETEPPPPPPPKATKPKKTVGQSSKAPAKKATGVSSSRASIAKNKRPRQATPTPPSSPDYTPPTSPSHLRSLKSPRPNHFQNISLVPNDKIQMAGYNKRKIQGIRNARQLDIPTLQILGIYNNVQALTQNIGIWRFLGRLPSSPTYIQPTFECLSSIRIDDQDLVQFRLMGFYRGMTLEKLCENLFLPSGRERNTGSIQSFWKAITGENKTKNLRTMKISHPTLRYIQRLIANTVFPLGESASRALCDKVYLMYTMMDPQAPRPDVGYLIVKHAMHLQQSQKHRGYIVVGAIATLLAISLDIDLSNEQRATGSTKLDLDTLRSYSLIKQIPSWRNREFNHILPNGDKMKFSVPRLDPNNQATWILHKSSTQLSASGAQEEEMPEMPQPTPRQAPPPTQTHVGPSSSSIQLHPYEQILAAMAWLDTRMG